MRAYLVPLALAASIAAAPMAFAAAAHNSTGAIKAYDAKAHSITLADGTTYMLPAKFKASEVEGRRKGAGVVGDEGRPCTTPPRSRS